MKARCVQNQAKALARTAQKAVGSPNTMFPLSTGEEYDVSATAMLTTGVVLYLTTNKWGRDPDWYPADLFQVVDGRVPCSWQFAYFGSVFKKWRAPVVAVWGYPELVGDLEAHMTGLWEADESILATFYRRRAEAQTELMID